MSVGSTQAPTWRWRRRTWASRNASSITSCSIGPASRPHGAGQFGTSQPAVGDAARPTRPRSRAFRSSRKASTSARGASASAGQVDGHRAAGAAPGPLDDQVVPGLLAAEQLAGGHGPAQEQVGVVLPGEADAAVHLDAALGAVGEGLGGDGAGDGRGEGDLVVGARPGRRPRPPPGPAPARRACRRSGASRPGTGRWGGRTARGPWRRPRRCRRTRPRRRPTRRPAAWRPGPGPGRAGPPGRAGRPTGSPSRRTVARRRVESRLLCSSTVRHSASSAHQPSRRGTTTTLAVPAPSTARHSRSCGVRGERHRSRRRAVGQARQQRRSASSSSAIRSTTAAASTVGRIGPGATARPELLQHDGQLGQAEARAAVLLGHVQAQPAQPGQLVPERRQGVGGLVQRRPCRLQQPAGLDPLAGRLVQRPVVLGDPRRRSRSREVTRVMAWVGQPSAALRILSSGSPSGSRT